MHSAGKLRLGRGLLQHLQRLAMSEKEKVGVCIGTGSTISALVPAENVLSSPVEFLADPLDIIAAHELAENLRVSVVALYHTHPMGGPVPSVKDQEGMKFWPLPWIIASRGDVKAWVLEGGQVKEVTIEVV